MVTLGPVGISRETRSASALQAHHAAHVFDGGLGGHRVEGDDLADAIPAVLVGDVADHLFTAVVGEVHVNVGHAHALRVQEALEEQVIADRIDVGDAQHVGDEAARGGATRDAAHALAARVVDVVPDDEEVGDEALGADDLELVVEAALQPLADLAVVLADAVETERIEILVLRWRTRAGCDSRGSGCRRTRSRPRTARRRAWCSSAPRAVRGRAAPSPPAS